MTTLYKKDPNGNIRYWHIEVIGSTIIRTFGVLNGEETIREEEVQSNTLRDEWEQAESSAESKIKSKIQRGYKTSIRDAQNVSINLNELGFKRPMLATRYDKVNFPLDRSIIQYKYDGHRCLITNDNGVLKAYSRNGKVINTIPEILNGMDIPNGITLDGELYHHGTKLQTISSWIKRRQENTQCLSFVCYDSIMDEEYRDRLSFIKSLRLGSRALIAPDFAYSGGIKAALNDAIEKGYEGLIIRPDTGLPYEDDKRSKGLIKLKRFFDDEFTVTDISISKDGWAILHCRAQNGNSFTASAPGTMQERYHIYFNRNKFIGQIVRIEYAMLTADGIPFHPVATGWRNKIDE